MVQTETSEPPARIILSDFLAFSLPDRTVEYSCEILSALKILHLLKDESPEAPKNLALASYNQTDSYWFRMSRNSTEEVFKEVLPAHPAVVVAEFRSSNPNSSVDMTDPTVQLLERVGYLFIQMFCGAWPVRLHLEEKSCHLIFQFVGNSQEPLKDNGRPVP